MKRLNKFCEDINYYSIINDILDNKKFNMMSECKHHGLTRLDHSFKVSYYSYKIAKKMNLNYRAVARAGLLHDFFIDGDLNGGKEKLSVVFHPYKSLENSENYFCLNDIEKDIIITHMFPTLPHKVPKYLESWLVSLVDKVVAVYEFYCSYGKPCVYRFSNIYIFLLLFLR